MEIKEQKTILITGGCGFIGSNLCKKLLYKGHIVICMDNLLTGSIDNILDLLENNNFKFINHDVIKPINLIEDIDEIYHLACPASPSKYQNNPIYTLKINFIGTMNMLELALIKNAKILLTSTSEVYGDPEISPQGESYKGNVNTIGPRSCYDEGKRVAETLMIEYFHKYNINIRIARIFNTYGPNMDINDGRVITNFISQALQNKDITIYGDGSQTRSFCYIVDQIEGLILLMNNTYIYPINIGNNNEMTVKELAEYIKKLTNSKSNIIFKKLPADDPTQRRPDLTRANTILNWKPNYNLEIGLKLTINYIKKKL